MTLLPRPYRAGRIWDYLLSARRAAREPAAPRTPLRARLALTALEERLVPAVDLLVNTYVTGPQGGPAVAADAAGNFVVAWSSSGQDGSGAGVYAQLFAADRTKRGPEFRVNTFTTGDQIDPAVAMDAAGNFVVAWTSAGQDGSGTGVYAQRFSATGTAVDAEFKVNTYTAGDQGGPTVAMSAAGNFVVAWTSAGQDGSATGVYAQRFSATGTAQQSEFKVNTYTAGSQGGPAAAMDAAGNFVVVWTSFGQDGDLAGVYAQRYAATGTAQQSEFLVNTTTTDSQSLPAVAMDANGDFVVSWTSYDPGLNLEDIYARQFSAGGAAQGGEFLVNLHTTSEQWASAVALDAAGNFVVAWGSLYQDGSVSGVYARRFSATGTGIGTEFRVNAHTTGYQGTPAVATGAGGAFVVAWGGTGPGDADGVFAADGAMNINVGHPGFYDTPAPRVCPFPTNLVGLPDGNVPLDPDPDSRKPVRYADGAAWLAANDLASAGGLPWDQTRTWSNAVGYATGQSTGTGWVAAQAPRLLPVGDTTTLAVVGDAQTAWYFDLVGGAYVLRSAGTERLTHNAGTDTYTLTTGTGDTITFGGFTRAPVARRGQFEAMTTAAGLSAAVTSWTTSGAMAEVRTASGSDVESYQYAYAAGVNTGLVASVTHRRSANGGSSWSPVDSVEYAYYDGTTGGGDARDLRTATIRDAAGAVVSVDYYRYYVLGEANGYAHGLKYAVTGAAYERLKAAAGGTDAAVLAASDATVGAYADHYFEYDAQQRVTKEIASGAGCSSCAGGQGTFTFSYTSSGNAPGTNSWAVKTVETLPDGNTNTVYTNDRGDVMLFAYTDTAAGQTWTTFYRYDSAGRVVWAAAPSAVTGYSDTYADLVNFVSGNAQYVSDATGLVTAYTYGASTTATAGTPGDALGYLKQVALKQGETAAAVPQQALAYYLRSVTSGDFFHVATETVYRNTNGTGGQTTSYAYTFAAGTNEIVSVTTTLPTVTTAQNGSNAATTVTTVFDAQGRPVWSKDQAGFLTYVQYDPATGGVLKTITDVDTTQTATFANLPSGWTTPAGGGLHLTTAYEVDRYGRPTKETTPEGRINYTVYNDAAHEVRYYAGWNTGTNTPTGPTVVTREDRANGYTETLTMTAAPAVSGGRPTGTEAISRVQSLSRAFVNAAGQVVSSDAYFDLGGLTYTTGATLGAAGVNFYRTQYGYDTNGNLSKTVSPEGTISRTVYDGLGRPVSAWVGTDDTPTTGFWSPTNLAGTNTVKVAEYQYDGGGVGLGNLTKVTEIPGGGAANRVTQAWFDWRGRAVAVKAGVEGSEGTGVNRPLVYTDYDNLGRVTKTRTYDADGVTPTITSGVPQPLAAGLLRAQSTTSYDELGRAFRSSTFSVNPSTGAVSTNSLRTDVWYDSRGNVIKTASPNGLVQKAVIDGAGRVTVSYATDGGGDTTYAHAGTVTGDRVVTQAETTYDRDGNVIQTTLRERFHDATGTGMLGSPAVGNGARVSHAGYYYDNAGRLTAAVDVGTNGGTWWTRPGTVPSRSATTLVTSYAFAADAVQTVKLTGAPTGGTFTLTFGGQTTAAIAYNASAATVQARLVALSSVGAGGVVVTAAPGGGWQVRFAGAKAGQWQAKLTASGTGLTGGTSPAVAVATVSAGGDAGGAFAVTDPKAIVSRTYADALGRATQTVEAFTNGAITDTSNKTVNYAYNSAGMTSLSAALTGGGVQTTQWVYGVTQAGGSGVDSNDVVAATRHPDATTGLASASQQETATVNALGQTRTATDRNGSVHTLTYDVLGRVVSDAVTTLGAGVDGAVRRVDTAYDGQGNAVKVTSYNAASGGSVVNEVQRAFDGLGQLTTEWQQRGAAVNTGTSPKVQYAYSFSGTGTANQSRLTTVTYPSGYAVTHNYAAGLDTTISRVSSLSDSTGTLESYDYLGLGTVVRRAHPQPGVDLTYVKQGAEPTGDAGDQYTGLDRFGRVVDQRWLKASTGVAVDRFQYGYDENSNRTFRDNLTNLASGELYGYDTLDQVASFQRGTLNGTKTGLTGAATRSQAWDYDALGNWDGVTTNGSTQARTANRQNEITSIGGATTPTYDANGNMTGDETGRQFVYDAWNRLVAVKNSGGTTLETFGYDGLSRRVTRTAGGTTTDLYYSADWQVLEEKVGANTTARYVWSPVYVDALVLRDRDTDANGTLDERLWVAQDANWNVMALIDGTGTVVERYAYDPFGVQTVYDAGYNVRGAGSSYGWVYGFQGTRYDAVSGFNEMDWRWYSPTLGRFTSVDPIRFAGGNLNLYGFVGNGPVNVVDPSGLQPVPVRPAPVRPSLTIYNPPVDPARPGTGTSGGSTPSTPVLAPVYTYKPYELNSMSQYDRNRLFNPVVDVYGNRALEPYPNGRAQLPQLPNAETWRVAGLMNRYQNQPWTLSNKEKEEAERIFVGAVTFEQTAGVSTAVAGRLVANLVIGPGKKCRPAVAAGYDPTVPTFERDSETCKRFATWFANSMTGGLGPSSREWHDWWYKAYNECMYDKGHGGFDPDSPIAPDGKPFPLPGKRITREPRGY
ncbi:rhs repeat-associated core domain-containing protein : YD repeat protein OS=Isosphaera pallida (strain ATCC 43644 / DSM 9630 / IS1B) GN=Isop_2419 PE=4 SV=1 [Gemmataceae bacterium]|nr:rhs repeat-associated core domain-containing protein : YD repeat protein OS=Isosphaera pallida (strain ATCC 43644 / DSM 9630 / IS1B) GN=Isop_2419 PE=4 SV=1 [Gemmataceae bacterium]VTU01332.1 rhs repeat-associated core domain-containing protein : YD repeat protein OS=Isosphaera pallida (strain ATCC 43644 / DSM 9630 / IS1B) GN=Isop_2419 PE=4 SV=1 [Gemmataceae bacterium]